jgi:hypothetical protein
MPKATPRVRALFERACSFSSVLVLLATGFAADSRAAVIPSGEVWRKAEEVGKKNDLDPLFIYSVACAESSLDDRADSGRARGIMQLTRGAWEEVSDLSYDKAWDWQTNMEVAGKYLHTLRVRLENSGRYSWPLLAASYHYGPYRVARAKYRMNRLPSARNTIYSSMFAGRMPTLPGRIPRREIDKPAPIQAFVRAEQQYAIVLPVLQNESFEPTPAPPGAVLEFAPLEVQAPENLVAGESESKEAGETVAVQTKTPAEALGLPVLLRNDGPETLARTMESGLSESIADTLSEVGEFVSRFLLVPPSATAEGRTMEENDEGPDSVAAIPVRLDTSIDSIIGGTASGNPTSAQ